MISDPKQIAKGVLIGLVIPVLGFFVVQGIFIVLTSMGLLAEVSPGISERRLRTITLIALCCNIIPIQLFKGWRHTNMIRGIVLATLLFAVFWIFHFKESLFSI